jgi:diphthamide biosynthesis enzyme Dph1/Dph2-like protein
MKNLFIPFQSKLNLDNLLLKEIVSKLPKNIAIVYSIQFQDLAKKIKEEISSTKNILNFFQILGCSRPSFSKKVQAILLIGNGKFHATSLAYETKIPVFIFDNNSIKKISENDLSILEKNNKFSLMNYLNSDKIGILISTKPGQQNLSKAIQFKKNLKNKKSYLFLSNELNPSEFDNFNLKSFVNTACPRMDLVSKKIINLDKIKP